VINPEEVYNMRSFTAPHLIVFFVLVASLGGCGKKHRMESQLMRPQGILRVVVRSDVQGGITLRSGTPTTPRVTISFREQDGIVVEQQDKKTFYMLLETCGTISQQKL